MCTFESIINRYRTELIDRHRSSRFMGYPSGSFRGILTYAQIKTLTKHGVLAKGRFWYDSTITPKAHRYLKLEGTEHE